MDAYPLQWPIGRSRTSAYSRGAGPNQMHGSRVRQLLNSELRKMGVSNIVVSSNVAIRRDGQPYAGQKVDDPGVVLYFTRKGEDIAISCDAWRTVDANLRAIGLTVEAIRGMERWGTEEMIDRAFTGFKALPESIIVGPGQSRIWHEVLQVSSDADPEIIRAAWKRLISRYHPDNQHTGDPVKFNEVQKAYKESGAAE